MATIAIFGGTGYAGGAIRDEALRRGHIVISVSRKGGDPAGKPGLISREGNLHDPALVDHMAVEASVLVVAIRAAAQDGVRLADVIGSVAKTAADAQHQARRRRRRGLAVRHRGRSAGGGPAHLPRSPQG